MLKRLAPLTSVVALTLLLTGCGSSPHKILYHVTNNCDQGRCWERAKANSISYISGQGIAQATDVQLPWTFSFTSSGGGAVSLVAQNMDDTSSASITCEIWVDDEVFKTVTSTGGYAVCTAAGLVQ